MAAADRRSSRATSGAWACGPATTSRSCCSRSAGPTYGLFQGARHDADPVRLRSRRDGAVLRAVARVPADRGLQLRFDPHQRGEGRVRPARLRPARRLLVVQGRHVRGRAAEPAGARARRELGRRAVRARRRRRRHRPRSSATRTTGCTSGRTPCCVEGVDPDGAAPMADGERCELVATSLFNRIAPLIRYRSDDIVRLTHDPCALRAHARAHVADRAQERRDRRRRAGRCCPSTCGPRSSRSTRARWACSR